MHTTPYLFVYGSLRQGFQSDAYHYISQYFTLVGNATTQGLLVNIGTHPVGIASNTNQHIIGELYQLKNTNEYDWAFAQLDDYEGIHVEQGEIPLYVKATTTVHYNNTEVTAWVYWYNGNVDGMPVLNSGDIFDFIKK